MRHTKTLAQRSGRAPEAVTGHSGRLPETPAYGSWLLGHVSDSQLHRRRRTQIILALLIVAANLIGIGIALLLVTVGVRTQAYSTTHRYGSRSLPFRLTACWPLSWAPIG